jgi:hypothetical protein
MMLLQVGLIRSLGGITQHRLAVFIGCGANSRPRWSSFSDFLGALTTASQKVSDNVSHSWRISYGALVTL